jgi:hypothetical protein
MAAAPAANVVKSSQYDSVKGAWIERGIATIIPAGTGTITANLGLECAFDNVLSCNLGDQIMVNAWNLDAGIIPAGARVTAQGTAKVKLYNVTGTNITDSSAQTFDYMLVHYS